MNHFCLDVLQRITLPDFLDFMRATFPYLYAIDKDNTTIVDIHELDRAYFVMHDHVVRHRFPNLVGGFEEAIKNKLDALAAAENESIQRNHFKTPAVLKPEGQIKAFSIPRTVVAGETFEIEVMLSNNGKNDWYGYGTHPVLLCYHWQDLDGSYLVYDGVRTKLKNLVLHAGESQQQILRVTALSKEGNFNLILTVVQEGVCWFEDKGFKHAIGSIKLI